MGEGVRVRRTCPKRVGVSGLGPGALALPLMEELLLVAREGVVGAVVVVRLDDVERLRADLDLVRMRG